MPQFAELRLINGEHVDASLGDAKLIAHARQKIAELCAVPAACVRLVSSKDGELRDDAEIAVLHTSITTVIIDSEMLLKNYFGVLYDMVFDAWSSSRDSRDPNPEEIEGLVEKCRNLKLDSMVMVMEENLLGLSDSDEVKRKEALTRYKDCINGVYFGVELCDCILDHWGTDRMSAVIVGGLEVALRVLSEGAKLIMQQTVADVADKVLRGIVETDADDQVVLLGSLMAGKLYQLVQQKPS